MKAVILLLVLSCWGSAAPAPAERFSVAGTVADSSGAVIPGASVRLQLPGGAVSSARTDASGGFQLRGVPAGSFRLEASADGLAGASVTVSVPARTPVRILLNVADVRQVMTVTETAAQVSTSATENLDTVTLDRDMLDNLPIFDQNYVSAISQFLDPGAVGTGGVTLIVNGMEQKNIGVSASAIQQVKINQNPYSAEFSRPGRGRIEVITKPSSPQYHGTVNFLFRDFHLNARDAFAATRPPEQRRIFEGNLTGPLGHGGKNAFMLTANREEEDLQAVVFANLPTGIFRANVATPQRNTELSAGITHKYSEGHLANFRFNANRSSSRNRGVGGFVLPEAGSNFADREDEVYYNDTLVITPKLLNQFRVLIGHQNTPVVSATQAPSMVVPGAFVRGGAQADRLQTETHGSLNEIVSWSHGKHDLRTGINVPDVSRRGLRDRSNFGGTYSFATLADYAANRPYSLIQQAGDGRVAFLETVVGAFVQDEFRVRPNLTLSAGLRYDWQNFFHDNNNFAPRFSFAYAPTKNRKTVLRGGAGFFYDRTGPQPIFDLERYNGTRLHQIVLSNPLYPAVYDPLLALSLPSTLTRLDPRIKMPYTAQWSFAVERQLAKGTTLSATYWATRGVGLFRSRDVNAPRPPDYLARPNPALGVYRQIEASGHLQNDALEVSFRGKLTRYFSGMAQYTFGRAYNDVPGNYTASTRSTGINAFPANNYDLSGEWARADYDQRHRLNLLGTTHLAKYADFGMGLFANTGAPYTETTGRDNYNTGYANARPAGVRRNSLQGPGFAELDLRWFHDFAFSKRKEGPHLATSLDAFNVTNRVNDSTYIGNLSSLFFGHAISSRPPRRLQVSLRFEF